jgi:alanine racemase
VRDEGVESRSPTGRGGVAEIFSKKLSVTDSRFLFSTTVKVLFAGDSLSCHSNTMKTPGSGKYKKSPHGLRTWIEIDRKAIAHNYTLFRKVLEKGLAKGASAPMLMAVAKSNAYGHSHIDFAREIENFGADWIGVDSVLEALSLREKGIKLPVLVLGYTLPEKYDEAAQADISATISSCESLDVLLKARFSKPLSIHLKIDTGMHRQGFFPEDVPMVIEKIKKMPNSVHLEGVFTHLAAKDPAVLRTNQEQLRQFNAAKSLFLDAGLKPLFHAGATWGTLIYKEAHYDMVRVGMGLYGNFPSETTRELFAKKIPLRPILTWKTIVSEIKVLKTGGGVGYDLTEELTPGSRIGICPVGYWHGYPRGLSSVGFVLVNGKRSRVVGRVSMDMIAIDLSHIESVKVQDEVVLVGSQKNETISPEEVAKRAGGGTSAYEFLTRINPLIKRVYL